MIAVLALGKNSGLLQYKVSVTRIRPRWDFWLAPALQLGCLCWHGAEALARSVPSREVALGSLVGPSRGQSLCMALASLGWVKVSV